MEFYPSADDYVHIASKNSQSVPTPKVFRFVYKTFLIINAIGFPAFLWLNDFFLIGFLLLIVNIAVLVWLIPWFTSTSLRLYYEHTVGPRENKVVRVDLTPEGINYSADDAQAFWPWRRITSIEETDESIFFYFLGNGFAVRKSGFVYHEDEVAFVRAANSYLEASRPLGLEQ